MVDYLIATFAIAAIAIAYMLAYQWLNKKIGNPKRVKEINENFKNISKEVNQAIKDKNDARIAELTKKQEEAMPTMFEMMWLMYKPYIAVIPILILLSNPQLNFNDANILAWPSDARAAGSIDAAFAAKAMGLPSDGVSINYSSNTTLQLLQNGKPIATLSSIPQTEFITYHNLLDNHTFMVHLRNESGKENLYFPLTRFVNPFAVQNMFRGFVITLPFSLPIFIQNFDKFPNWRDTFGPTGWFWLCVIFGGFGLSIINTMRENNDKKAKGENGKKQEDGKKGDAAKTLPAGANPVEAPKPS